jgi:hypothetical protein
MKKGQPHVPKHTRFSRWFNDRTLAVRRRDEPPRRQRICRRYRINFQRGNDGLAGLSSHAAMFAALSLRASMRLSAKGNKMSSVSILQEPGRRSRIIQLLGLFRAEWFLIIGVGTSAVLLYQGNALGHDLSGPLGLTLLSIWLSAAAFGCCLSVVRHAEHLAVRLGEPYGTLLLTLAVTLIEVMSMSSVMTHGADNPALARDTIFSVIMILLAGMVALSLLLGGWRHYGAAVQPAGRQYLPRRDNPSCSF